MSSIRRLSQILMVLFAVVLMSTTANAQKSISSELTQRNDSVNKAVATVISASLEPIITNLSNSKLPVDKAQVGKYIAAILGGENFGMTPAEANAFVESIIQAESALSIESQQDFLKKAASEPGSVTTPSGLVFQVILEGEGVNPSIDDQVYVKYVGRFSDGTVFDDTGDELVTFDLENEIPGFVEGLKMMKPGGKYRIVVPAELAYGEKGIPGIIPGNAALDFTVTLDSIKPSAK